VRMSKEEIQGHLNRIGRDADRIQEEQRRKWLQRIVNEGKSCHGFKSLGELVAFIVTHVPELQKSSEKSGARRKKTRTSKVLEESEEIPVKFG
jgi:hypothetical protein